MQSATLNCRLLSVHLSRLEPKALRLSAENFLLLLLPLLLMAVVAFAKSQRADFDVLAVSDTGDELIYRKHATPLDASLLCRDQNGAQSSVELERAKSPQSYVVTVAAGNRVVAFTGDKLIIFDTKNLMPIDTNEAIQCNGLGTRFLVSANGKFMFCNSQGGDYSSDNYFRSQIIDLNSGEVTWEGNPFAVRELKQYFDAVDGDLTEAYSTVAIDNTIVEFLPDDSSDNLVPVATYSFESGVPTKVRPGKPIPYLSADGKRSIFRIPGAGFQLRNEGRDAILDARPADLVEIEARSEHQLLFQHDQRLKLFDWRSMKFENTIDQTGDFGAPCPVLSADGNTIAREVTYWNCSWAHYLRSGSSYRSYLEILDAKTGNRIRTVEDNRPFWMLFILSIGGSLIWSVAWIWARSSDQSSHRVISDVMVISLLWFSIALLKYLFGGWLPDSMTSFQSNRPASAGLACTLGYLVAMVAIWAAFSRLRWSFRLPVAMIGVALLWGLQKLLCMHFDFEYGTLRLECIFVLLSVYFACVFTRSLGWHLALNETSSIVAQKRSLQIPLTDLFLFPLAIGLCFAVFSSIVQDVSVEHLTKMASQSLSITLTAILACWAAFSTYEKPKWILALMFLVCLFASVAQFQFWNEGAYWIINNGNSMKYSKDLRIAEVSRLTATASGSGLCALLALCFVSRLGWKWQFTLPGAPKETH